MPIGLANESVQTTTIRYVHCHSLNKVLLQCEIQNKLTQAKKRSHQRKNAKHSIGWFR